MKFSKYHALGNDYLVLDPKDEPKMPSDENIIKICHRNFGLGSDGILYGPLKTDEATFGLEIYNPDSSQAEKSGNGLRIFARYLFDEKLVKEDEEFSVMTLGGKVFCKVMQGGQKIKVDMGKASFSNTKIPVNVDASEVLNQEIELLGEKYLFNGATVGNPHCVILMDEVNEEIARKLGPIIENHPLFPNRTNVQFMKILDRNNIEIQIWERGAGYTLASGSSSSAAASVAKKLGHCDGDITVHMAGGILSIQIDDSFDITMTGPATAVGKYTMSQEVLTQKI